MTGHAERPSLLVVEDDEALRDTLARALAEHGFAVRVAATAEIAVATASAQPPEYATVDLRLPDGTGLGLVSTLLDLNPGARIVVLTGYGSIATAIEAIKQGAIDYLTKPITVDDVIAAFERGDATGATAPAAKPMSLKRLEWEHIERVPRECDGNVSAAARALSMHRRTLQRKLAKRPVRK